MEGKKKRLLVLYASQTGNAMDVAERVGREAERGGCPSVEVQSMDHFDPNTLPSESTVIFVVSTTGQGDPPDTMKVFWRFLLKRNLGSSWLEGLHYAVFGLGDSGYQKYNFAAKKLDKRLQDLGAKPIIEKGLGDDQHPSGYEGALDPWLMSLWKTLNHVNSTILPEMSEILHPSMNKLEHPKFKIMYHASSEVVQHDSHISDLKDMKNMIERARSMSPSLHGHDHGEPHYLLKMVTNKQLSKGDDGRDVRQFVLEPLASVVEYQVGDVLEVLPGQNPAFVDAFIKRCKLDPDSYITIEPWSGERDAMDSYVNGSSDHPIQLRTFVSRAMDVASASPRRYFFEVMSYYASAEHEKEKLQFFASPEGRDDLYQYNQKEHRTVLEVLEDFPSVELPFEWLVQLVPPLKKRLFSISSSPLAHPNQVHLTVSVVSTMTPLKRRRYGLCSSWLASLDPNKNEEVLVPSWIHRGTLPPPPPMLPLILIGPGTGCAPFRAYIEERAMQNLVESTAPILFFFGCRNRDSDFLYQDFWLAHSSDDGILSEEKGGGFYVAFSREQERKVYVQHKIREQSARVWGLLNAGAAIYLAGSSTKMPADVTEALEEVVAKESGVSREAAARWLKTLEKAGRFNIETWS
ncbi:NADPH-dependent diflavin oxidoreductase 1 [Rhynchospora pubera]|uniref:NADPH-dependent diflavin oxidoreductase 1 n=1 Tax=Rhynchospora pubera TaxID=906938 RepID=A0AAV8EGV1_9POAL|nr:NADPH-dependent diflavin oxidoreductase 1 [Rhynchospora pubera]